MGRFRCRGYVPKLASTCQKILPFYRALLSYKLQYLSNVSKIGLFGGFTDKKKIGSQAQPGPISFVKLTAFFQTAFR